MKKTFMHDSCLKKKRYKTLLVAEKVKEKIFKERGLVLRIYYCNICNGYHITRLTLDK